MASAVPALSWCTALPNYSRGDFDMISLAPLIVSVQGFGASGYPYRDRPGPSNAKPAFSALCAGLLTVWSLDACNPTRDSCLVSGLFRGSRVLARGTWTHETTSRLCNDRQPKSRYIFGTTRSLLPFVNSSLIEGARVTSLRVNGSQLVTPLCRRVGGRRHLP